MDVLSEWWKWYPATYFLYFAIFPANMLLLFTENPHMCYFVFLKESKRDWLKKRVLEEKQLKSLKHYKADKPWWNWRRENEGMKFLQNRKTIGERKNYVGKCKANNFKVWNNVCCNANYVEIVEWKYTTDYNHLEVENKVWLLPCFCTTKIVLWQVKCTQKLIPFGFESSNGKGSHSCASSTG